MYSKYRKTVNPVALESYDFMKQHSLTKLLHLMSWYTDKQYPTLQDSAILQFLKTYLYKFPRGKDAVSGTTTHLELSRGVNFNYCVNGQKSIRNTIKGIINNITVPGVKANCRVLYVRLMADFAFNLTCLMSKYYEVDINLKIKKYGSGKTDWLRVYIFKSIAVAMYWTVILFTEEYIIRDINNLIVKDTHILVSYLNNKTSIGVKDEVSYFIMNIFFKHLSN